MRWQVYSSVRFTRTDDCTDPECRALLCRRAWCSYPDRHLSMFFLFRFRFSIPSSPFVCGDTPYLNRSLPLFVSCPRSAFVRVWLISTSCLSLYCSFPHRVLSSTAYFHSETSYIPRRYILYSRRTLSRDNCYCFSRITTPVLVFCRRRKQFNGTLCSARSLAYLRLVFYSGRSEFVPASAGTKILCCVIDSSPCSVGHSM